LIENISNGKIQLRELHEKINDTDLVFPTSQALHNLTPRFMRSLTGA